MTIDDESSIYVGGLPYEATEESIRRVFSIYGRVVAVKIINDRATSGRCYGFVTFTNPRSAIDAMNDMDGKTIGGRVVKVNEVQARGGRANQNRDAYRRNIDRDRDWDKGRGQEMTYDRDRDRFRDRNSDQSREHHRSREKGYGSAHDHERASNHLFEREDSETALDIDEQRQSRKRGRGQEGDHELDRRDGNIDIERNVHYGSVDKDNGQRSGKLNGSVSNQHSREVSSGSSYDHHHHIKEELERSFQRRDDLKKEISLMEERLLEKQQFVLELQRKSEKLEDALVAAKKLSSHHHMRLNKLHKIFLQVREYGERLRRSEEELQSLVDTLRTEADAGQ